MSETVNVMLDREVAVNLLFYLGAIVSEDWTSASWTEGHEYRLWAALVENRDLTPFMASIMKSLAEAIGGWIRLVASGEVVYVPRADWLAAYEAWKAGAK